MRLSHNLASLNVYNQLMKSEKEQGKAMNRVATGLKISKAADGPYASGQSENQRMQIRGLQMAQRNVQNGVSMLQVNDGALGGATEILLRIRELVVQSGGVESTQDKEITQNEISKNIKALDYEMSNTEFNGIRMLNDASGVSIKMTQGANSNEIVDIPTYNLTSGALLDAATGKYVKDIDVTTVNGNEEGIQIIDSALRMVSSARVKYGALENRFESTYSNLSDISLELQKAESGTRDADIAEEMIEFSKNSILVEAGNALMVQTNRFPMEILKILENVRG